MSLFQQSVQKKYIKTLDSAQVEKAYKKFTKYFHNPKIQENIRNAKEEQFQEGFLRELFVSIFGYTLNPDANFNLTTELKNEKGAKKADGAILKEGNALAVIELKGTNTKDLEKIRQQAFDYKANQTGCVYVITSNFEKLRFYINNAVDFEEFNLFTLSLERFNLLYLCLHSSQLLEGVPLKAKEASLTQEENITKQLYADYSLFKRELYRDLVKQNTKNEAFREQSDKNVKLTLFKKSQKLLDRFLFVFFAEDRGLLPPNSISSIIEQWEKLEELDAYAPLYERYKLYFTYLDQGRKGKDGKGEIFAYNGGLFKPDPILDSLLIDDALLAKHTKKLSSYDFESEVDVNILGHIFEHSLNEIESVNAEIEGEDFDKQKSKRKKDGVFYTPKYITQYIVNNTVGKLCTEKKDELKIIEEDYTKGRKGRQKETIKRLDDQLKQYREWLLSLTICDPACGSGAFLNQALNFLIEEHTYIDELTTQLFGGGFTFPDVENHILENNIYGVDLNEESVEIAKLSLWLRTAQPRRKLTSLNNNIKCGNSLIDDKKVAGDKAFHWQTEFAEVFAKGGFDVIVGNPPYVRQEMLSKLDKEYFIKGYKVGNGIADLYVYFYEAALTILKQNGVLGFITPNKFYKTRYGKELRQFLIQFRIIELIDFFELKVFEDASTDSQILIIDKSNKSEIFTYSPIKNIADFRNGNYSKLKIFPKNLSHEIWVFNNSNELNILNKMNSVSITLDEYTNNGIFSGIKTGLNEAFIINEKARNKIITEDPKSAELIKPYVSATDIDRYFLKNPKQLYFINTYYDLNISNYRGIFNWLLRFDQKLQKRQDKGLHHYNLRACKYYDKFDSPKIIYIHTATNHKFYYDKEGYYINNSCYLISNADKFLSVWLNSKIFSFYKKLNFVAYGDSSGKGRAKLDYNKMINVPIPSINLDQKQHFIQKADEMLSLNKTFQEKSNKFKKYFSGQFDLEKLSKKLENWHELTFTDFIKELNKAIKKANKEKEKEGLPTVAVLTKKDEIEWMDVFEDYKKEVQELQTQITQTDNQIDLMVYKLYELTHEEVLIVDPEFSMSEESYNEFEIG